MNGRVPELRPGVSCVYCPAARAWIFEVDIFGPSPAGLLIRGSQGFVYYDHLRRRTERLPMFPGPAGRRAENAWARELAANKTWQLRQKAMERIDCLENRLMRAEAVAALIGSLARAESIRYLIYARIATFAPAYAQKLIAGQ